MKLNITNGSIRNLSNFQAPRAWDAAEGYLDISKKGCRVTAFDFVNKKFAVQQDIQKKHWAVTAAKVISYVLTVGIAPLIALAIIYFNRNRFQFDQSEQYPIQHNQTQPKPSNFVKKDNLSKEERLQNAINAIQISREAAQGLRQTLEKASTPLKGVAAQPGIENNNQVKDLHSSLAVTKKPITDNAALKSKTSNVAYTSDTIRLLNALNDDDLNKIRDLQVEGTALTKSLDKPELFAQKLSEFIKNYNTQFNRYHEDKPHDLKSREINMRLSCLSENFVRDVLCIKCPNESFLPTEFINVFEKLPESIKYLKQIWRDEINKINHDLSNASQFLAYALMSKSTPTENIQPLLEDAYNFLNMLDFFSFEKFDKIKEKHDAYKLQFETSGIKNDSTFADGVVNPTLYESLVLSDRGINELAEALSMHYKDKDHPPKELESETGHYPLLKKLWLSNLGY
ncbi:MAG: hypothetical protein JHC93_07670 [Parachlamydiales bacterium]|nr:hypothetical protein [Parachlamydiales bacterium]